MSLKSLLFPVICAVLLSGCDVGSQVKKPAGIDMDSPAGLAEYLRLRRIPALQKVELWRDPGTKGLVLTTEHYKVYTTMLDHLILSQVPGFLESAYRGYNEQLSYPVRSSLAFTVYLFNSRQEWDKFTDNFAGGQAPMYKKLKAGAYYLNGSCVAYNIGRENTFSVLGHEGWHQFNSRHFRYRLPSWLDEGIAMLFETSRYEGGFFYFEPEKNLYRLANLKVLLNRGRIILPEQLIALNPGEVILFEQSDALDAFYAESYALVRFLREDNYFKRLLRYQKMLTDGMDGRWPLDLELQVIAEDRNVPLTIFWNQRVGTELFDKYIIENESMEQIQQEYIAFCRKITSRVQLK
jgi:hypothetical protein